MSDNPIDFMAEKDKRSIDEQYRLVMPDGSKWYKYIAEFDFQGSGIGLPEHILSNPALIFPENKFTFEFWARDMEDAQHRLDAIKSTAVLGGQIFNGVDL